jgi:hypothetical protein
MIARPRAWWSVLAFGLVAATALPGIGDAQQFGGDAVIGNRHVWRGIMRKRGFVFQPDVHATVVRRELWMTAGVWANVELEKSGTGELTDRGTGRRGLSEVDYWIQSSLAWEGVESTLGWTTYTYTDGAPGAGPRLNTSEIYGKLRLRTRYLSPELRAYWDVDRVDGFYFEGSVSLPVLANPIGRPFWSLFLGATAGYNQSQGLRPGDPDAGAHFNDKGLTHLDLSAALNLHLPNEDFPAAAQIVGHLQFNRDEAVKRGSLRPGDQRSTTPWIAFVTSFPVRNGSD